MWKGDVNIPIGAHLVSPRTGYTHHGIYIGNNAVIHYAGLSNGLESGPVEETDIQSFSGSLGCTVKTYKKSFPPEKIVKRAKSRLGEESYNVLNNNCEHFCLWCIRGDHKSAQVDTATWISVRSLAHIAGLGARAVVACSGTAAGLSGSGIMSGLAAVGGAVGGGAVAGIGLLGGLPALAMASLVNNTVLSDNPALEEPEKKARSTGRKASYTGAAAGTAGSIAALSAAGATGLSGAGITSGLAAIGGAVGGGMAAGVALTTAAPVVAAAGVGYGVYRIRQKLLKNKENRSDV